MIHDDDDEVSGVFEARTAPQLVHDEPGRVVAGRYEIVERIGAGGMGQVVRVRHLRLGKSFALKLMRAEASGHAEARELFVREAQLASVLSHDNIVSIVDFGDDPDWGLFIVMEYLEGETLLQRLGEGGPLPVPVVCDVAAQLVAALRHIHAHDVVHGDLKSENVLCLSDEEPGRRRWNVKLLDFGMAQLASATAGRDARIGGTPEYLAPERIVGGPLAASVDIYALGVILYEMLVGAVPFSGDDPRAVLHRQLDEQPEPIEARRGESVDPSLLAVVGRALEKKPEDRYQTVSELADDLRAFMHGVGLHGRASTRAPTEPETRAGAAAAAFDALGIPAVGLRNDGTIVIANTAFARLVRRDEDIEVEGLNLRDTPIARLHPGIYHDLRLVAIKGKLVRRRVTFTRASGKQITMRLLMTPASGACGDCLLAMYALPPAKAAGA